MNERTIEGGALAVREEPTAVVEWTPSFVRSVDAQLAMLAERDRFYKEVLHEGVHYGVIPGTQKPSLWKPGAEALCSAMALHAETGNEEPPVVDVTGNDHNGEPFVQYVRWCRIYRQTGPAMADRIEIAKLTGACNSWEPKYRYRNAQRVCPTCGKAAIIKGKQEYGGGWVCFKKKDGCGAKFYEGDKSIEGQDAGQVANENVLELLNTILKMADKRALIAATLVATGCSDIFNQDLEDMPRTMGEPRDVTPRSDLGSVADAIERANGRAAEITAAEEKRQNDGAVRLEERTERRRISVMASCSKNGITDAVRHAVTASLFEVESSVGLTYNQLGTLRDELAALVDAKVKLDDADEVSCFIACRTDLRNEVPM